MALLTGQELADAIQIDYSGDAIPVLDQVAEAASDLIGFLITTAAVTAEYPLCKEAALSVGSEIFQARYGSRRRSRSNRLYPRASNVGMDHPPSNGTNRPIS
jgi:hypothetical protein